MCALRECRRRAAYTKWHQLFSLVAVALVTCHSRHPNLCFGLAEAAKEREEPTSPLRPDRLAVCGLVSCSDDAVWEKGVGARPRPRRRGRLRQGHSHQRGRHTGTHTAIQLAPAQPSLPWALCWTRSPCLGRARGLDSLTRSLLCCCSWCAGDCNHHGWRHTRLAEGQSTRGAHSPAFAQLPGMLPARSNARCVYLSARAVVHERRARQGPLQP